MVYKAFQGKFRSPLGTQWVLFCAITRACLITYRPNLAVVERKQQSIQMSALVAFKRSHASSQNEGYVVVTDVLDVSRYTRQGALHLSRRPDLDSHIARKRLLE